MIGTALVLQAGELLAWAGLYRVVKRETTRQILTFGKPQPLKIPIVDRKLEQLAGHPSRTSKVMSDRAVKLVRRIVNTRAFEMLVLGVVNRKSRLHAHLKKPTKIEVLV